MFYLPALIILIGILLNKFRALGKIGGRTLLFAVVLVISNFLFYIYPYTQVRKETPLSLAMKMNDVWSPKTVGYFSGMDSDNRLVKYFNPATTWVKLEDHIKPEEFESQIRKIYAEGGEVWLETTAIKQFTEQSEVSQWFGQHSTDQSEYKLKDPAYNMTVVKITP